MAKSSLALLLTLAATQVVAPATAQTVAPPAPPAAVAPATPAPGAGMWEFSVAIEGGPGGDDTRTGRACLAAEPLGSAPEQTLVEAAVLQTGGRASKCTFDAMKREGAGSSWSASCQGPMGMTVKGPGRSQLGAEAATLSQTLEGRILLKTISMKRTISAKRTGSC